MSRRSSFHIAAFHLFVTGIPAASLLAIAATLAPPALASPLPTAFTFQGELQYNGGPGSEVVDLQFNLYDAPNGGAALCSCR